MHTVGRQQLSENLPHEAVTDDQSLLVRVKLEQIKAMHRTGNGLDGCGVAQGDVVGQRIDHGGRSGELLGQTTVTSDADGAQMVTQFRTLSKAVLALTAVDVRIDGHPIADLDVGDLSTDCGNDARVLMPQHDRRHGCGGARTARIQIVIGTAHTRICGVDQHLIRQYLGSGQILDLEFLDAGKYQSLHDCSFPP